MQEVLERILRSGMKLKPKKYHIVHEEVAFLGHIVGRDGIRMNPERTEAVRIWKPPKDVSDLRSFLGLCSYYRRFVPGFAEIAVPLFKLTKKKIRFSGAWSKNTLSERCKLG